MMAQARGQRGENESDIDVGDMVGDDEQRPFDSAQILAADDAGRGQQHGRGPDQKGVDKVADPAHRPALRPARILIVALPRRRFAQRLLKL